MTFEFDPQAQAFRISLEGFRELLFSPSISINDAPPESLRWKPGVRPGSFQAKNRRGAWELKLKSKDGSLEVSLQGELTQKADSVVLTPVRFHDFRADHVLVHGRQMGGCESYLPKKGKRESLESNFLIALTRKGYTLQLSHPLAQKALSSFSGDLADHRVTGLCAFTTLAPCRGKRLKADPVVISISRDGNAQMESWAKIQAGDRELLEVPQESGWNSWDYYRWTISEEEVLRNAELIASDPVLSRHVKRIVVDDGWQYCYGEWEANPLFPSGMESLAKKLARMGFTPGLWFAPTIAEPHSRVAQLHPEMLAPGPAGVPFIGYSCMERKGFILDPTHPSTVRWWQELFRRYSGFGYRYFKLDFLSTTVKARRFAKASAHPGELMKHIIAPIREAVGPQATLLGCNFTFDGGPGLVDAVRVASDIHASWRYVKRNVLAIASRFWAHRRFWINDPDFAVCRGEETSDDPNLHQLKMLLPYMQPEMTSRELGPGLDIMDSLADLTAREAETWMSMVVISGGAVNLSDNLPRLNEAGLHLVRRTVAAKKGEAGIALDLFQSELPAYWVQKVTADQHRILIVNWTDRAAVFRMDLNALNLPHRTLRNFWTDQPVKIQNGYVEIELPPHGCLLATS